MRTHLYIGVPFYWGHTARLKKSKFLLSCRYFVPVAGPLRFFVPTMWGEEAILTEPTPVLVDFFLMCPSWRKIIATETLCQGDTCFKIFNDVESIVLAIAASWWCPKEFPHFLIPPVGLIFFFASPALAHGCGPSKSLWRTMSTRLYSRWWRAMETYSLPIDNKLFKLSKRVFCLDLFLPASQCRQKVAWTMLTTEWLCAIDMLYYPNLCRAGFVVWAGTLSRIRARLSPPVWIEMFFFDSNDNVFRYFYPHCI